MEKMLSRIAFAAVAAASLAGCAANAAAPSLGYVAAKPDTRMVAAIETASSAACEIRTGKRGAMIEVTGVITAPSSGSGTYRLAIKGSGNGGMTDIDQSSGFEASAGEEIPLGYAMLSAGAAYDVKLEARIGSKSLSCSDRVGGMKL